LVPNQANQAATGGLPHFFLMLVETYCRVICGRRITGMLNISPIVLLSQGLVGFMHSCFNQYGKILDVDDFGRGIIFLFCVTYFPSGAAFLSHVIISRFFSHYLFLPRNHI
jgi:hypothetical protein